MRTYRIVTLIAVALLSAACAHQPQTPAMTTQAGRPIPRGPAEEDPRYALPQANSRSLTIFLDSQSFEYVEDNRVLANGPLSSGSAEHPTPTGDFRVLSKEKNKRSGKYTNYFDQNTPMPYSLQFYGPYFVHEGWLPGYADSHGCVRLRYEDARFLFSRMKVGDQIRVTSRGGARTPNPWLDLFPVF